MVGGSSKGQGKSFVIVAALRDCAGEWEFRLHKQMQTVGRSRPINKLSFYGKKDELLLVLLPVCVCLSLSINLPHVVART